MSMTHDAWRERFRRRLRKEQDPDPLVLIAEAAKRPKPKYRSWEVSGSWGGGERIRRKHNREYAEMVASGVRTCSLCGETKALSEFRERTLASGRRSWEGRCKSCTRVRDRELRQARKGGAA